MSAVGDIIAEVLGEHYSEIGVYGCACGANANSADWSHAEWHEQHVGQAICERLGVQESVEYRWSGLPPCIASTGPDGQWITPPDLRRTVTSFEHVGEWEAVDE